MSDYFQTDAKTVCQQVTDASRRGQEEQNGDFSLGPCPSEFTKQVTGTARYDQAVAKYEREGWYTNPHAFVKSTSAPSPSPTVTTHYVNPVTSVSNLTGPQDLTVPELRTVISVCQTQGVCTGIAPVQRDGTINTSTMTTMEFLDAFTYCKKNNFTFCAPVQKKTTPNCASGETLIDGTCFYHCSNGGLSKNGASGCTSVGTGSGSSSLSASISGSGCASGETLLDGTCYYHCSNGGLSQGGESGCTGNMTPSGTKSAPIVTKSAPVVTKSAPLVTKSKPSALAQYICNNLPTAANCADKGITAKNFILILI